jgi:diacylglycerol kinase (ATP)
MMDKRKLCLIYNPAAKGEKARSLLAHLQSMAASATLLESQNPGDAKSLAAEAVKQGFETIVAAGGDGTLNEVVNGIGESNVKLGVLPIGTMNVFALEMGLPGNNIEKCWDIILRGESKTVDLARANDHLFLQLAGVGLDAQALKETDHQIRRNIGPLSYILSAAEIIGRPAPRLTIETPEYGVVEASFVLIGNGKHYGGPIAVFPDAKNDDGLLDVILFKNLGYLDVMRHLQEIVLGTQKSADDIQCMQSRSIQIRSAEPVPVEVDGEVALETPVMFELTGHQISVLV